MQTGVFVVIKDHVEKICCVRHAYGMGKWGLPGGAKEKGECVVIAGKREVREETGLSIVDVTLVGTFMLTKTPGRVVLCRARIAGGMVRTEADEEIAECAFFSPEEIQEMEEFFYPAQFKLIQWEVFHTPDTEPIISPLISPAVEAL